MKAAQGNRWLRAPLLLFFAASGLALSASGCIIDNSSTPDICLPDLTISWRIVSNVDGATLTCAQAGNADTVTAQIDGGAFGSALTSFPAACPANATSGSFIAQLPASGTYNVSLELTSGAALLSETNVLVQPVDCSGNTATPVAPLYVNF
jgi:hypothetical protein